MVKVRTFKDLAMSMALLAALTVIGKVLLPAAILFAWFLFCLWVELPRQPITVSEAFYLVLYAFNPTLNRRKAQVCRVYNGPERRQFRVAGDTA